MKILPRTPLALLFLFYDLLKDSGAIKHYYLNIIKSLALWFDLWSISVESIFRIPFNLWTIFVHICSAVEPPPHPPECKIGNASKNANGPYIDLDRNNIAVVSPPGVSFNTMRPRQNGRHFADDTFKRIFMNENVRISINISLKFVPKGLINNTPASVQIMAWRRPGDKPLSEPMMVSLLTHICVTRPQWVNTGD